MTTVGEACLPVGKRAPREEPTSSFEYIDIGGIDGDRGEIAHTKGLTGAAAPSRARQLVRSGDTVLSTVRTYLTKTAIVPAELDGQIASTGFSVLRPAKGLEPRFLFYYLRSPRFVAELSTHQTGSSYPAVRDRDVRAMRLPLPPLQEQQRIADAIEEHLSVIDRAALTAKSVALRLPRLLDVVMRRLVHGYGLSGDPEISLNPGHALPEGWSWKGLGDLGEMGRGKSKHRPRNDPALYGGPYPFVQTGDVAAAEGVLTDYRQTYSEAGLAQSRLWPAGTVVITIAANIADSAVLGFDACFPDSVVGLVPDPEVVRAEWVEYFLRVEQERLERFAPATAQKNINLKTLQAVVVPVPPPEEQGRILAELEAWSTTLVRLSASIDRIQRRATNAKHSILTAAFSGQLTSQDPSDEPASTLLERILAEKSANQSRARQRVSL